MEFLKETFGTEALTYDQLAEKLKGSEAVKLGNLAGGAYVGKDKFAAVELERDSLRTQLGTAAEEIKSYKDLDVEGIKKAAADWEAKHTTDTKALQEQLDAERYSAVVKDATKKE